MFEAQKCDTFCVWSDELCCWSALLFESHAYTHMVLRNVARDTVNSLNDSQNVYSYSVLWSVQVSVLRVSAVDVVGRWHPFCKAQHN